MMQPDSSVVSQRVLYQGVSIFAVSLGQTFILFGKIHTVALNPCRNPSFVVCRSSAVREVDLIVQLMVLALEAHHIKKVDIGRSCTNKTVNDGLAGQQVVDQQRVHSRDVAVNGIIVNTIAECIVMPAACRTHHIIKNPRGTVICLDRRLHVQYTAKHVTQVSIEALNIRVVVSD